ncbi:large ribosomal subunit protein bL33m [Diutina catenulata]
MAKPKGTHTMIKLVSAAKTGYEKWFNIPRSHQKLNLILYDPRARRHCLFTEDRKRKVAEQLPKDYSRSHRG